MASVEHWAHEVPAGSAGVRCPHGGEKDVGAW